MSTRGKGYSAFPHIGAPHKTVQSSPTPPPPLYLNEGVDLHSPALGQCLNLHLAAGAHVQMVHCGATPKPAWEEGVCVRRGS